jgi:hypothetical protein
VYGAQGGVRRKLERPIVGDVFVPTGGLARCAGGGGSEDMLRGNAPRYVDGGVGRYGIVAVKSTAVLPKAFVGRDWLGRELGAAF